MNTIIVDVYAPGGPVGRFGFYTLPRVGENVRIPGITGGEGIVQKVIHFADPNPANPPAPYTQIIIQPVK